MTFTSIQRMTQQNRQWRVATVPNDRLSASNFTLETADRPEPAPGQVLCRVLLISIDAAGRAWFQADTYRRALRPGDVMPGFAIGQVVASRCDGLSPGDIVSGDLGWQEYAVADGTKLDRIQPSRPLPNYLSVLGVTGLTAFFGLLEAGGARPGETVVVSAAAGATGSIVGQIARLAGCRVVGICGSPEKQRFLTETLGFDAVVNHRDPTLREALRSACPSGADVYFDNVGGRTLEVMMGAMGHGGRIVCCGAVSQYDTNAPMVGVRGVPGYLILRSLTMRGFLLSDYLPRYGAGLKVLERWLADGSLRPMEEVLEGLEEAPEALVGLLNGANLGKRMIRVAAQA
ncbi:NADP-dependent oxidoreductase [Ideonella sp. B508-1]|uniref:NADP-dependent oxidoreductase n=1 Tax=Ideonella sp. B508-1 TaxID=137716 RepID=UPI0003495BC6|nr:NADP-dependent oxidoreductase [Ideonella sp. B508-1]